MPDAQPDETPAAASETPSYVTQDQLNAFGAQALDRIGEIVARAVAQRDQPRVEAPAPPSIDLEALNQKFRDGAPDAATEVLRAADILAERKVAALRKSEVDPLRAVGTQNLEAIAKDMVFKDNPIASRFKKEIEAEMGNVDPQYRGNVEAWRQAAALVRGRHADELEREAVERAIRAEAAKPAALPPGGGGQFLDEARTQPVPSPEELLGENTRELMAHLKVRTPDELARARGHKDWVSYVKFAREYDTDKQYDPESDLSPDKLYPNSPKGVRRTFARI